MYQRSKIITRHIGVGTAIWSLIQNLRKESKITVPDRNIEPAITSIQTNMADEVEIRHTPPIRGGFAEFQKKGLRIKDYHTTEKE